MDELIKTLKRYQEEIEDLRREVNNLKAHRQPQPFINFNGIFDHLIAVELDAKGKPKKFDRRVIEKWVEYGKVKRTKLDGIVLYDRKQLEEVLRNTPRYAHRLKETA